MDAVGGDAHILGKLMQWGWLLMAAIAGFFLKTFHTDVKEKHHEIDAELSRIREEHSNHKLHVAQNYLTNVRADRMEEKIDKIYEAVVKK